MKTLSISLFIGLVSLTLFKPLAVHGQYVVTNPISDVLAEVQHLEDIAKSVEMINNQVQQIQALNQQLNQIRAYVDAFGDPAALASIVGADQLIDSVATSGLGQTLGSLQQLAGGVRALGYNAEGLYQSISDQIELPSGESIQRAVEQYRPYAATQQATENYKQVFDDIMLRRQSLREQIGRTTEQLQSSTTDAETQKLSGVITGLSAELGAVDRELDQAYTGVAVQDAANRNDSERQARASEEARRAFFRDAMRKQVELLQLDPAAPAFPEN